MLNLIRNENMKIYRKVSTWIMISMLLVIPIFFGVVEKVLPFDQELTEENWKKNLEQQNAELEKMNEVETMDVVKKLNEETIQINQYRIENDLPPNIDYNVWGFVVDSTSVISIITLFTIIVGGGILASEFSSGTIKLLLIRPVSRSKILLSKYLSTNLFALLCLVILFVCSFIVGAIFFGFDGFSNPHLAVVDGDVVERSMFGYALGQYALSTVNLIMMSTFAFMISTIFRNSSLAIGLAIFLMFTGVNVTALLAMKFDWARFILFANTDLKQYTTGMVPVEGMTLTFSIIVLVVYFVIFNALSWFIFNKRDVAA